MPAPSVSWHLVDGTLQISGDRDRGYTATATFKVAWADAFTFADDIMGRTTGLTLPPTWQLPWQFPNSGNAKLYAKSFSIKPMGSSTTLGTNQGLIPGEFYQDAFVDVTFETPSFGQSSAMDPSNNFQLDPSNPITLCEQSVDGAARMVTRPASGYEFEPSGSPPFAAPVKGDFAVPETEASLVLTFPRVPFLPWKKIRPYLGKVNLYPIFDCSKGSLLLEKTGIRYTQQSDGTLGTAVQLYFQANHDDRDWNMLPKTDGTYRLVRRKGDTSKRIFDYVDFGTMFN